MEVIGLSLTTVNEGGSTENDRYTDEFLWEHLN